MKTKKVVHTPGPWAVGFKTKRYGYEIIEILASGKDEETGLDREVLGAIAAVYGHHEESDATARLIAAAPDLRKAVSACLKMFSEISADRMASLSASEKAAFDLSLFAIAKAERGDKEEERNGPKTNRP
jgi:hypothetical protein